MRVLLDTHAFLWLVTDDPQLSRRAKRVFLDGRNEILLSAVSAFEIAVKYSLGKLKLSKPPAPFIAERIQANALSPLPITIPQAVAVAELPAHYSDPFDRLLVAQALVEDIPLLSRDRRLSQYGVRRIW
jgi:PIN domain nuclease of toxin-antitoxin system